MQFETTVDRLTGQAFGVLTGAFRPGNKSRWGTSWFMRSSSRRLPAPPQHLQLEYPPEYQHDYQQHYQPPQPPQSPQPHPPSSPPPPSPPPPPQDARLVLSPTHRRKRAPSSVGLPPPPRPPPSPPPAKLRPIDLQLISGAIDGDAEAIIAAVRGGAVMDAQDEEGDTPLNLAAYQGYIECVHLLLQMGARAEVHGKHGMTAVLWGCQQGHLAVVQTLLAAPGVDLETRNHVRLSSASSSFRIHLTASTMPLSACCRTARAP